SGGAGEPGATEWDGVLRPARLGVPLPAEAVALEVASHGRLELDEAMLLPALTPTVYPVAAGGRVTLGVPSAGGELRRGPGERGRASGPDGTPGGQVTRRRRSLREGAFAIVR